MLDQDFLHGGTFVEGVLLVDKGDKEVLICSLFSDDCQIEGKVASDR